MARAHASVSPKASDGQDMRVLLFLKGFGPGGVERIALRLSDGLYRAGRDLTVLVAEAAGAIGNPSAVTCHVARFWPVIGRRWPIMRLVYALWREMGRAPPAILFCPGNAYTIVAVILKLLLGQSCPPIVAKVSNDLQRPDLPRALRPLYRFWLWIQGRMIDHFAILSVPMGEEVMALMRVGPDRIHIVPNPVLDDADIGPDQERHRPRRAGRHFVAIGRLERQKNYPAMLRAFAIGARHDDRLTIFGEGSEREALTALAASLDIGDRVDMPGHCPEVCARLSDHDILLLSSAYEGLPGAVIEALAAGLWVIATRCSVSMPDLLDHGALGRLTECGDESGFALAIRTAEPGQQDRARAARKASHYTLEAAVPAYTALFDQVIAQRQARSHGARAPSSLRSATSMRPV
ncbi:glycosyltransferase [Sphingobium sp. MK2]|uniref:glycosyltransferase n=1 Tax=Sphingobium sp. MK2 TaxID=3116540 RepID=UPI0032E361AF